MLQGYVEGTFPSPLAKLSNVATWLGQFGALSVLKGNSQGWLDIDLSHHYLAWDERLLFEMVAGRTADFISIDRSVFVMLHAMAVGRNDVAVWLGNRMLKFLSDKNNRVGGWHRGPVFPFAMHLFARWQNVLLPSFPENASPLDVYEDILKSWESDSDFEQAMIKACDVHVWQAFDDNQKDTQDFFRPLYSLFPVEILAICQVRIAAGFKHPAIRHPLLETPLAKPDLTKMVLPDSLLRSVVQKICSEFGTSESWT